MYALAVQPAVALDKPPETLTVFAAASLKTALDEVNTAFTTTTGIRLAVSYAATSALTKQIEQGAPADVFISADQRWMDYASEHKLIDIGTRGNLLGNQLVLIAQRNSTLLPVSIAPGFDIVTFAGQGRIAVANIESVPAGRYAKAALIWLGAFEAAQSKLAQSENVRAALALVSRGEAPTGIVYSTDAKADPGVKVIGIFPESSHPPVSYPVAATVTAKPATTRYLQWLRSIDAKTIFERHGFSYLIKPAS